MKKEKKLNLIGQVCLFSAILVWGSSFVILKETMKTVPTFYIVAVRFLVSSLLLSLIFIKKIIKIKLKTFIRGAIIGLFLTGAYLFQTIGLKYTTPARNAFLTSAYCVMCPFIVWIMFKTKPELKNFIAAFLAIIGIGFTAIPGGDMGGTENFIGDGLTLVAALFFAFQIIFIDKYQRAGEDGLQLLIPELLTVGVVFAVLSLCFELPNVGVSVYALNTKQLLQVAYLTLICTLFAQMMQIIGQKYTTSAQSSIILSGEAVCGALFSVIVGYEKLSVFLIIGFLVMFIAMLLTEIDIKSLLKKKSVEKTTFTEGEK